MTGRIIRSRRCNARLRPRTLWAARGLIRGFAGFHPIGSRRGPAWAVALASLLAGIGGLSHAATLPKLPVIHNVGVVPLQWEGEDGGLADARQALEDAFPRAVRDARRFRVLGDDLVASLWKDAAGREELRGEFELTGFVGLTVTPRGDVVQLTARLMDGWLKTNLLETDTTPRAALESVAAPSRAGDAGLADRLEKLVFRLFNRLPVDVSVTSVQGSYVTLSGGAEQGIEAGDKVDLIRATVRSLHPANGTWVDFTREPLGKAQVIEVKGFTAVAKLVDQTRDGAVEVGDGARIPAIASRVKFQRLAGDAGFKDAGDPGTIVVPPLYQGETPTAEGKARIEAPRPFDAPPAAGKPTQETAQGASSKSQAPLADGEAKPAASGAAGDAPDKDEDGGPTVWDQLTDEATSHRILDDITAYGGPYWWKVRGPGNINSSGRFPIFLLNSFGGGVSRTMLFKIKAAFGGGVIFGKTPHATYVGYDSYARMYWEDELNVADGFLKYWRAGGAATFSGMSVPKGGYGGGDWIRGGAFGALGGSFVAGSDARRFDWFADYTVLPLNIGRIGYDGTYKSVESAFGTKLSLGGYRWEPARVIQWGGGLDLGDERQTLKDGRRPHFSDYSLKVLVKYGL